MRKDKKITVVVVLIISIIICSIITLNIVANHGVEYSLNNCVTFFDTEARFQLMYFGKYIIADLSEDNDLYCANILYYKQQKNLVYFVYGLDELHCAFAVLDVDSGMVTYSSDTGYSDFKYKECFENFQNEMIDLTKERNTFEVFFNELIPQKYRKW